MKSSYLKYPQSIKSLISEIKNICDDYVDKIVTEQVVKYYIDLWITQFGKDFYHEGEFNSTVKARIGSKRMNLIKNIVENENL